MRQVKKRNGTIVDFDPQKIVYAMEKAFAAGGTPISKQQLAVMLEGILHEIDRRFGDRTPTVEQIQDVVELRIMMDGYHQIAKSYIVYRYEHQKIREEKKKEVAQKAEEAELLIMKRDGRKEPFSEAKIRATLKRYVKGYESEVDIDGLINQLKYELYEDITTQEIRRALIMVVRSMIEIDPAYSKVAAKLLLDKVYKDVFGADIDYNNLVELHAKQFNQNIKIFVESGLLDPRMLDFDTNALGKYFDLERDALFEYMGLEILTSRYFLEDPKSKKPIETPQMFWMRIAMGTAILEPAEKKQKVALDFYDVLSNFYYTPGGRTLFQAGALKPQLSNCFINMVPDSLDGIFKAIGDNAQYLKWSGGTGTSWTSLRATGAYIKGTGVGSQGVIPFLKIANDVNVAINRSGKRRGAGCIYLETWHLDVEDFLELRKNTGDERRRTHDINTANWIPDLFMKRVRDGQDWTLFSPDEVPDLHEIYGKKFEDRYVEYEKMADEGKIKLFKRIPATDLWKKMLAMLFETGHPWITFKDPCNIRSPQDHVGVVHSSNLCTEITLNTTSNETAVCTLGSLNFAKLIRNGEFDLDLLGRVTKVAIRMLDNVIDINFYPTEDARRGNMNHRPVGLGIRGYHDALYMLGINFDTDRAVAFADTSMEVVAYYAILASSELAKERGTYSTYKGSKWDRGIFPQDTIDLLEKERGEVIEVSRESALDWTPVREHVKKYGMRNSNTMAIAPTASTANLVGCIPCVEPIYKNIYVKSNKEGDFVVVNKYLVEDLKAIDLWNREMLNKIKYYDGSIQEILDIPPHIKAKYKEVFEIDPSWLIRAAAARGKWIDQSQSLNIFFRGTSGRDLSVAYFEAWKMGLKTTYYLRTLGASQVEKATVSTGTFGSTHTRGAETKSSGAPVISNALSGGSIPVSMPQAEIMVEEVRVKLSVPSVLKADTVALNTKATPSSYSSTGASFIPIPLNQKSKEPDPEFLAKVASGEAVGICESCEG